MKNPISLRWGLIGTTGFADRVFAPALKQASQVLAGAASATVEHSGRSPSAMDAHTVTSRWTIS